jgi:hypothetical protein
MRSVSTPLTLATFVAFALIGCAPQDGTGGTDGGAPSGEAGTGTTKAGQACLDMATVYATAAKRCGGNYDAERAAFIRETANDDCNSVTIRNETELRTKCFPSLGRISCVDLKEVRLDPSCAEQIIRSK